MQLGLHTGPPTPDAREVIESVASLGMNPVLLSELSHLESMGEEVHRPVVTLCARVE